MNKIFKIRNNFGFCLLSRLIFSLQVSPEKNKIWLYLQLVDKPDIVNVATDTNIYKGNYKIKQEPDLYHLNIRSDRQAAHHRYVHADQDQHDGDVHSYGRLKVEWLEVVCDVSDNVEKNGWNVDCCEDAEKTAAKKNIG